MASIKGERTELKPGFFAITRDAPDGKALAFFNETADTQFNICYTLTDSAARPLGRTVASGDGKYAISVYPGETVEFIQGKWAGFKRSLSFGAPDKAWQEKQAQLKDSQIEKALEELKALVKSNPKADGKYTAEYIADLCEKNNQKFIDLTFPPKPSSLARDWEEPFNGYDHRNIARICLPQSSLGMLNPMTLTRVCFRTATSSAHSHVLPSFPSSYATHSVCLKTQNLASTAFWCARMVGGKQLLWMTSSRAPTDRLASRGIAMNPMSCGYPS